MFLLNSAFQKIRFGLFCEDINIYSGCAVILSAVLSVCDFYQVVGRCMVYRKRISNALIFFLIALVGGLSSSCGVVATSALVTVAAVKTTYTVTKGAASLTWGTGKLLYKVVKAPLDWPLTHDEIETIDGLTPKEAIAQGRVKNAPYVVRGKKYRPMGIAEAARYREKGTASWYGDETLEMKGGHMTANGEAFDPDVPSAAHKLLPLPINVRVTNLENGKAILVRVNDRGPFIPGRIIDLSESAARKLGFFDSGTAEVLVETVDLDG